MMDPYEFVIANDGRTSEMPSQTFGTDNWRERISLETKSLGIREIEIPTSVLKLFESFVISQDSQRTKRKRYTLCRKHKL